MYIHPFNSFFQLLSLAGKNTYFSKIEKCLQKLIGLYRVLSKADPNFLMDFQSFFDSCIALSKPDPIVLIDFQSFFCQCRVELIMMCNICMHMYGYVYMCVSKHWCQDRNSRNNNKHVSTETTPPSQATFRSLPPFHLRDAQLCVLPNASRATNRPRKCKKAATRMPCTQSSCIISTRTKNSNEDVQSIQMCKQRLDFLVRVIRYCAFTGFC